MRQDDGRDARYGLDRRFLRGRKDYSKSNSVGSRGVRLWYELEHGKYYEIKEQITHRYWKRYFATVNHNGAILDVERAEIEAWLNARSASTCTPQPASA